MSTRTKLFVGVGVLAVVVLVVSRGREEPSALARSLEADPMAAYVPTGGTLARTDRQNEGFSLGERVLAQFDRYFDLRSPRGQLDRAREAAARAGWKLGAKTFELADTTSFSSDKQLAGGPANLTVTLYKGGRLLPKGVRPPALRVSLRHDAG